MTTGAGVRLPGLPAASGFSDSDLVYMTQSGATVKGTIAQLRSAISVNRAVETFNAGTNFIAGTTTSLTLAGTYGAINNIDVYCDGAPQLDCTLSGNTLTFNPTIPAGIQQVVIKGAYANSIGVPSVGTVGDAAVATGSKLRNRMTDVVSVRDPAYGAKCDGVTDDSAACQMLANAVPAGAVWEVLVPASMVVNGTVTAGTGTIAWRFAQGAALLGIGSLPFHASSMSYNASPNIGKRHSVWHGTQGNPTTDGTVPSVYIQRVDRSVTADDPGHLISALYVTHKRLTGGTGWLYGGYFYLEDQSNSAQAQSAALTGAFHGTVSGAGWGIYGEANSHSQFSTIQGGEFDCLNYSGHDYAFNHLSPFVGQPFSMGVWSFAAGGNRNTIAVGVGAGNSTQSVASSWYTGIYMQPWSCTEYGVDIQAQPKVLINFENGASTDGTGITVGGIGLDCGAAAAYGTSLNQCAIHQRTQRVGFGSGANSSTYGWHGFNQASGNYEWWYGGVLVGHLVCASGADHAM